MTTRITLTAVSAVAALAIGIGSYAFAASSRDDSSGFTPPFMRHIGAAMMQGMGPDMTGHDAATMAQMGDIHELFVNHDRITRTVTNLPDRIRTVTESEDPRIAQLLKDHVATMRQRVDTGNNPGLPIESKALHSIFQNYEKIETKVEMIERGVVVIQTSTDPTTVAALQQHASEVTDFVNDGMAAMRTAMMRNAGGMMQPGMHGGMMRNMPNGGAAPDAR